MQKYPKSMVRMDRKIHPSVHNLWWARTRSVAVDHVWVVLKPLWLRIVAPLCVATVASFVLVERSTEVKYCISSHSFITREKQIHDDSTFFMQLGKSQLKKRFFRKQLGKNKSSDWWIVWKVDYYYGMVFYYTIGKIGLPTECLRVSFGSVLLG